MDKSEGDGQSKPRKDEQQFVHMLNSTLTATERTICCILETYQTEDGVEVPRALQPYMGGIEFLPFKQPLDVKQAADSKSNKSKSKVFICLCWSLFPKQHSKLYFLSDLFGPLPDREMLLELDEEQIQMHAMQK